MSKKDKQKAAARARAGRRTNNRQAAAAKIPIWPISDGIQVTIEPKVIFIDDESDDCGYTGGVNYTSYSDEEDNVDNVWFDDSDTESEQIDEMEGEELDRSLQALKAAIELYEGQGKEKTILDQLGKDMSSNDWTKVESNRALGYLGNSGRSKRRKDKNARDQAQDREAAKTLYVHYSFTLCCQPNLFCKN